MLFHAKKKLERYCQFVHSTWLAFEKLGYLIGSKKDIDWKILKLITIWMILFSFVFKGLFCFLKWFNCFIDFIFLKENNSPNKVALNCCLNLSWNNLWRYFSYWVSMDIFYFSSDIWGFQVDCQLFALLSKSLLYYLRSLPLLNWLLHLKK